MTRLLRIGWGWLLLAPLGYAAWLMLQLTLPYTALQPGIDFLKTKVNVYHIAHWRWSFYTHVFTGILALVTGFTQFSGAIIRHRPWLHRICGYAYVANVMVITGPAALVMSFYANGGWPARLSFVLQSVAWLGTTGLALYYALKKKFRLHGAWMLRSYALTLAAITLRSYAALLSWVAVDMRPADKYILIAWASWVPNLLVAQWLLRKGFIRQLLERRKVVEKAPVRV